ncbi:MAG: flagellar biosynthesis protein FliQ [Treponema sp.]|nr:flagellar biosynthesis protein FliQ [Treponema sp.]
MSTGDITNLLQGGIFQVLTMAAPLLLSALAVGLVVAILQAATSIQEQTLTFVPKIAVILIVLALFGGVGFASLGNYTIELFGRISQMR